VPPDYWHQESLSSAAETEREIIQAALELMELQGHVVRVRDRAGNVVMKDGEVLWEMTETGRRAALRDGHAKSRKTNSYA
jgi:hypothetical protein